MRIFNQAPLRSVQSFVQAVLGKSTIYEIVEVKLAGAAMWESSACNRMVEYPNVELESLGD